VAAATHPLQTRLRPDDVDSARVCPSAAVASRADFAPWKYPTIAERGTEHGADPNTITVRVRARGADGCRCRSFARPPRRGLRRFPTKQAVGHRRRTACRTCDHQPPTTAASERSARPFTEARLMGTAQSIAAPHDDGRSRVRPPPGRGTRVVPPRSDGAARWQRDSDAVRRRHPTP